MKISPSAGVDSLRSEIRIAAFVAGEVIDKSIPGECILTFGSAGVHSTHSLHYKNRAIDIDWEPWNEQPADIETIAAMVRIYLGNDYDVVPESTHLHIEHDPK